MKTEEVQYASDIEMLGYVAYPEIVNAPLVLIAHTWAGKDNFVHQRANELAELGFVAMAVDMYGNGRVGRDAKENESLMSPLISDRDLLKSRINCALEFGRTLPGVDSSKVAAIGYCFGGLVVLDLARSGSDVKGVVSFHGLLMSSNLDAGSIKSKILVLHGERDPMVPLEMVEIGRYHAFTNPEANDVAMGTQYNKEANDRSWQAMLNFFEEIF